MRGSSPGGRSSWPRSAGRRWSGARLPGAGFAWVFVVFFIAVPTVVAYLLNAWAIARASPSLVTVYIYLQPLIAALLQWVQLGERLTARALGASVLIVAGVGVVASRRAVSAPARA